ncbi:MAG: SH3 domain-containing protein [Lachnospiraceae bacterium]|nr:SH3 domain-containing protein [Lachnospiraceae bacterium]MBR5944234.1 SH3 domain-containing protein [Lachnospiraceae bacterium]
MKKKVIPALIAIVLIILIAGIALGGMILEKYSYSDEMADLNEYFDITDANQVPILYRGSKLETKLINKDNNLYLDLDSVHELLNERFYWDNRENWLIYATPTAKMMAQIGDSSYTITDGRGNPSEAEGENLGYAICYTEGEGDNATLYVALEYVHKFTNFEYRVYEDPKRVVLVTEDRDCEEVTVTKESAVRHRGGVKSPILEKVAEGDKLILLEEMEDWSKVETDDGLIGYIEKKHYEGPVSTVKTMASNYTEPEYTSLTSDSKISLGWHVVAGVAGNDTIYEATAYQKGMDVISPTWFKLADDAGNMTSFATQSYVNAAHNMGLKVWGLVDDFSNDVSDYEILSYTSKRERMIDFLITEALNSGLDGINVDFEKVSNDAGPHYVEFLRELSIECRAKGLVLSVDDYVPYNFNSQYNIPAQGEVADYVIIMGYDEHYHGSGDPGSVASIDYVKHGITETLKSVPANKVINALPLYTIQWRTNGATVTDDYVTMNNQADMVSRLGGSYVWDETTCQNYLEVNSGGTLYQVWLEDAESIQVKLNVMKANEIGGVAVWRLGYEDPAIWNIISAYSEN